MIPCITWYSFLFLIGDFPFPFLNTLLLEVALGAVSCPKPSNTENVTFGNCMGNFGVKKELLKENIPTLS